MPIWVQIIISDEHTLVASPTNTTRTSLIGFPGGLCSIIVKTSLTTWVGWL